MHKRIIFDIDDTLIPWDRKYYKLLKEILKSNGIKIGWIRFYKTLILIEKYDKSHTSWNTKELKECLSKSTKLDINDDIIKLIFSWLENCVLETASESMHDTLAYLSQKYELVVLSNSIEKIQAIRLEKFGIKKYFKEIYCGDEVMKPNKQAYLNACGKHKPKDCIMIGDNLQYDVIEPEKLGMKVIYVNKKKHKNYTTINSVVELKNIL